MSMSWTLEKTTLHVFSDDWDSFRLVQSLKWSLLTFEISQRNQIFCSFPMSDISGLSRLCPDFLWIFKKLRISTIQATWHEDGGTHENSGRLPYCPWINKPWVGYLAGSLSPHFISATQMAPSQMASSPHVFLLTRQKGLWSVSI